MALRRLSELAAALAVLAATSVTLPGQSEPRAAGTQAASTSPAGARQTALPSAKVRRYAARIIQQYDDDGDGRLSEQEWSQMQGQPNQIDADQDGHITVQEFGQYVADFAARRPVRLVSPEVQDPEEFSRLLQPKSARFEPDTSPSPSDRDPESESQADDTADSGDDEAERAEDASSQRLQRRRDTRYFVPSSRLPANLPAWFHSRDQNGDAQLTLAEYAANPTASSLEEFRRYDRNADGVITAREAAGLKKSKESKEGSRSP